MKKHFYFLTLILLCVFVGCSDDTDYDASIEINDGQETVQKVYADDEVGTSAIKFKTTAAWTSGIYASGAKASSTTPDWVRITPNSGDAAGEYSISINFDVNTTGKKRSATIAIKCNEEESYIRVSQEGITKDGNIPGDDSSKDIFKSITDVAFATYCKKFDTNGDNILSVSEAKEIKVVDIAGLNISNLAGIEYFVNLETLNCPNNYIISLDLSKNENLTILNCSSNSLVSLDVTKNKLLDSISCANNAIKSLDLSKNYALVKLDCQETELTSLDISANTKLKIVNCSDNNIATLNTSSNIALEELTCISNNIESLDLSKNEYLTGLKLNYNPIATLNISNSAKLEYLYCSNTNISSLDLSKNIKLKELECKLNSISSLDVSKLTDLKHLDCEHNPLATLNISANQALTSLNCYTDTNLTVTVWSAFDTASPKNSIAEIEYNKDKTTFVK